MNSAMSAAQAQAASGVYQSMRRRGMAGARERLCRNHLMPRLLSLVFLLSLVNFPSGWAASRLEATNSPGRPTAREEVLGSPPLLALAASTVASEDGQHLAFVVRRGVKFTVWHDGAEGDAYRRINQVLFSTQGAHLAYVANKDEDVDVVVLDGKELATQTSISPKSL